MRFNVANMICLTACAVLAQAPTPAPAFEVAVIKPVPADYLNATIQAGQMPHTGVTIDKTRVDMGYQSLAQIIVRAYEVAPFQIAGPDYLKIEKFDILAKIPNGATEEQVPQMLRTLLEERFSLTVHKETRELPVYALVIGKNGLKSMKPATAEEQSPEPQESDRINNTPIGRIIMRQTKNGGVAFMPGIGVMNVSPGPNGEHIEMSNLTMSRLAQLLMTGSDRLIVDKTGLKGSYQVAFDEPMNAPGPQATGSGEGNSAGSALSPALNPMFQAVEAIGLKLESQKGPVEMLVVDHTEKTPTEN